jgi:hypothetical protein
MEPDKNLASDLSVKNPEMMIVLRDCLFFSPISLLSGEYFYTRSQQIMLGKIMITICTIHHQLQPKWPEKYYMHAPPPKKKNLRKSHSGLTGAF